MTHTTRRMTGWTRGLLFVMLAALLLSACGADGAPLTTSESMEAPAADFDYEVMEEAAEEPAPEAPAPAADGSGDDQASAAPQAQEVTRLIVKNAFLSLQVEDVTTAEAAVNSLATAQGGFVVEATTFGTEDNRSATLAVRVPAERFETTLAELEDLAVRTVSREITGNDVTEEFVDLGARLTNLEATRDRLVTLLDDASRVSDALEVNQALTEVQGNIERIQGRMRYLRDNAALSTIRVSLEPVPSTPLVREDGWQPLEVARGALAELIELGQELVNTAIVVAVWLPVWLPLLLVGRWGWQRANTRIANRKAEMGDPPTSHES